MGTFMPGVYSSPLLIAASIALIVYTYRRQEAQNEAQNR
jgi:hypothetical protein